MSFKDVLKAKVPEHLQHTPEFPIFLKLVKQESITSSESLKHYLSAEIERKEKNLKELAKGKSSTSNRQRVEIAKNIDFLRLILDKILPYVSR